MAVETSNRAIATNALEQWNAIAEIAMNKVFFAHYKELPTVTLDSEQAAVLNQIFGLQITEGVHPTTEVVTEGLAGYLAMTKPPKEG